MKTVARCTLSVALCASFAFVTACGPNGDDQQNNDNHLLNNNQNYNNQNNNQVQQDGSVQNDAATGTCDLTGYTPTDEQASPFDSGGGYRYVGYSATELPTDLLSVEMYTSGGFGAPTSPGTYSLSGSNYETCGLCLRILQDCSSTECNKIYYADEGDVEISSLGSGIGSTFSATLHNVVFKEVTIDEQTFHSTPVTGGNQWCVNGYSFNETLVDPNDAVCSETDINCVGETVPDFQLLNCSTNTMVSMHTYASGANALWFVGSHEWCSVCAANMPGYLSYYDSHVADGLKMAIVLGENDQQQKPTLQECQDYAAQYSGHEDLVFLDHDGQYSHATLFTNLYYYPDSNQMIGFPWQAVVDPSDWSYDYADNDGSGTTAEAVINGLLP